MSTVRILHSRSDTYLVCMTFMITSCPKNLQLELLVYVLKFYQACILIHGNFIYIFFSTDAVTFLNSHFGASTGTRTVYLDEVQCTGRETNLTDCSRSSTVSCSSIDSSYAGVRCQGLENCVILEWCVHM